MGDDELDNLQLDKPPAQEIVEHFSKPLAETPMGYKEICEPLLKELYFFTQARKEAQTNEKDIKDEVKVLLGLDRGMIQRGTYGVKAADTKGKAVTDWKKFTKAVKDYVVDQMGKEAAKEIERILAAHTTTGEPGVSLTPYRVGEAIEED